MRHVARWNMAALADHGWKIISDKEYLWVKWVQHGYMEGKSFWDQGELVSAETDEDQG